MNRQIQNHISLWNNTHVYYDLYENDVYSNKDKVKTEECKWRNYVLDNAPHGELILNNSFFKTMRNSKKIYLAHTTPNIHNIFKDGKIFPSSGCLVASIYCTPLVKESGYLRAHNLGEYILKKEMPQFQTSSTEIKRSTIKTLIFEINLPQTSKDNLIGTDYLRLGQIHYQTFKDLEYLLSSDEKNQIRQSCIRRIRSSMKFLCTCNRSFYTKERFKLNNFLEDFCKTVAILPILGYFYFEILSEYIMLFQDNEQSLIAHRLGEFYTPTYKDIVFTLNSNLFQHFSLTKFNPDIKLVINYLKNREIFKKFDEEHFRNYVIERLIFLTNARLFECEKGLINWEDVNWNFEEISSCMKPLMGHLIHRELRCFGRYPNFYFYFDQLKALQIWNYWNQLDLAVPFNGIIPKGEVGLNPAYPNLKYSVYLAKIVNKKKRMYMEPGKKQDVQIIPRLVDPRFTAMGENKKETRRKHAG